MLKDYEEKIEKIEPTLLNLQVMLYEEFVKDITIDSKIITKEHENKKILLF